MSAVSLIGGVIVLGATFAITYFVLGRFFNRTRELGDGRGEEPGRKRSLNPNLSPAARQLITDMEEQARRSDQKRRARFREHFERPLPPITPEGRDAIELAMHARLAIKHVFPPRLPQRSMSYFGGLPIIPGDDFDWPTVHNREGLLERLNFMAQIDCSDLPPGPGRHLLPDKGYLYFFAPMSDSFGPEALHFVCRYLPGPVRKSWEPVDMPATTKIEPADPIDLIWRGGKLTHFDRFEVEFGWIEEPSDEEVAERSGEGHAFEVAEKIRREGSDAFYGPPVASNVSLSAHEAPKDELWVPYEGFPANWRSARILRRLLETYQREEDLDVAERIKALEDQPADENAEENPELERLKDLQIEIRKFGMRMSNLLFPTINLGHKDADAPPDELKEQIRALLDELRTTGMPSSKERTRSQHALPQVLNKWLEIAAIQGAEAGLTDPEGAALIPPDVIAALAPRHASREHQMLGEGVVVQVAADEMKTRYIMLLQLGRDAALNWTVGEMGPLQYWITPEDLAAKRFENTVLTMEAY